MGVRDKPGEDFAKILVVDDDESILFTSRLVIEGEGHQVITALEGITALQIVHKEMPDLILLDLEMPGMDGYEVCKRLKADPATANIPVVFLSAQDMTEGKVRAFAVGGVDYLVKPYSRLELLVRLQTHLALQRTQNKLVAEVEKRTAELQEKNRQLQETNLVLKRLLHEVEEEKQAVGKTVQANIERLLLPSLLSIAEAPIEQRYRLRDDMLKSLKNIALPLTGKQIEVHSLLSPAELRLLSLIRQGQSSKEIAQILNISPQTVATHRRNIRKKLNISGKKVNLASFIAQSE